jgi:cytochrome c peroxidase
MKKKFLLVLSISLLVVAVGSGTAQALTPIEQLGKSIFFDKTLSINENQSCAACHGPEAGWTGPLSNINALGSVYEGSIPGRFGNRKPPSAAYATTSPIFHLEKKGLFVATVFHVKVPV